MHRASRCSRRSRWPRRSSCRRSSVRGSISARRACCSPGSSRSPTPCRDRAPARAVRRARGRVVDLRRRAHDAAVQPARRARATRGSRRSHARKPGSVFIAESFEQVDDSWWFLGDDFRESSKRDDGRDATSISRASMFHAYDRTAPLGVGGRAVRAARDARSAAAVSTTTAGSRSVDRRASTSQGVQREIKVAIALVANDSRRQAARR